VEIIIIQSKLYPFTYKISEFLKNNGVKINCVVMNATTINKDFEKIFENKIFLFNKNLLWSLLHIPIFFIEILKIKKNILIGITSSKCYFVNMVYLFVGELKNCIFSI